LYVDDCRPDTKRAGSNPLLGASEMCRRGNELASRPPKKPGKGGGGERKDLATGGTQEREFLRKVENEDSGERKEGGEMTKTLKVVRILRSEASDFPTARHAQKDRQKGGREREKKLLKKGEL